MRTGINCNCLPNHFKTIPQLSILLKLGFVLLPLSGFPHFDFARVADWLATHVRYAHSRGFKGVGKKEWALVWIMHRFIYLGCP